MVYTITIPSVARAVLETEFNLDIFFLQLFFCNMFSWLSNFNIPGLFKVNVKCRVQQWVSSFLCSSQYSQETLLPEKPLSFPLFFYLTSKESEGPRLTRGGKCVSNYLIHFSNFTWSGENLSRSWHFGRKQVSKARVLTTHII